MKCILLCSLSLGLTAAGALQSIQYGALSKRSQALHVSLEVEAYMNDIASNVTSLFENSHTKHPQRESTTYGASPIVARDLPNLVERDPDVPTATTVQIPNDPPPLGTQWDESFQDTVDPKTNKIKDLSGQRAALKTAWNEAVRLASLSQQGLQALNTALQAQTFNPNDQDGPRNFIAHNSPPMAQFFGSLPANIQPVHDVFDRMINVVPDVNGGNRGGNILRVAYGDNMRMEDGSHKVCGAVSSNTNNAYAATYPPDPTRDQNDLQAKYRFADSMIVFCPAFFDVNLKGLPALLTDSTAMSTHNLLDGLRTKGQTVLHEWAHLPWIQDANSNPDQEETYFFNECAQLFQDHGSASALNNADQFAVFASYHAYNQESWAPVDARPGFGCHDVWPTSGGSFDPAKPVKDTFP